MTSTTDFYVSDYWETLFPMKTNRLLIVNFSQEIGDYISEKLSDKRPVFFPQKRVFATKPRWHLRRTVKLDPIAEFYLYDLMFRNRHVCRKQVSECRRSFGYKFEFGNPIPISPAYKAFKLAIEENSAKFAHRLKFDISAYFNSIYHHNLSNWFNSCRDVSQTDKEGFGNFCRAINAGMSVDFLPQGLYPSKMIGNEYLKFVDNSGEIKSSVMLRFMDDFYLFDDSTQKMSEDFVKIQQLLGLHGLNVNPSKTVTDDRSDSAEKTVSRIHEELMEMMVVNDFWIEASSFDHFERDDEQELGKLGDRQVRELLNHFRDPDLSEVDAELILNCLKSNSDSIFDYLEMLLSRFPNMVKQITLFALKIEDAEQLANVVFEFVSEQNYLLEFQIFWLAILTEEKLSTSIRFGEILIRLYELSNKFNYQIAVAKILEIPVQDQGLKEIRSEILRSEQSDWRSWASAIGTRNLDPQERNYTLGYFANNSEMNRFISSCIQTKEIQEK